MLAEEYCSYSALFRGLSQSFSAPDLQRICALPNLYLLNFR